MAEWTWQCPIHEAYTYGHAIRRALLDYNPNVHTAFVETQDTLDEKTDGKLILQMKPSSPQTAREAFQGAVRIVLAELEQLQRLMEERKE